MTSDVIDQVRDYLNDVRAPVTIEEITIHPAVLVKASAKRWRGPLVALVSAGAVVVLGVAVALVQGNSQQVAETSRVVKAIIAEDQGDSFYAVGFDRDGSLCAETGARNRSQTACGASDRLTGLAFRGESSVAIAGWVPRSVGDLTAIYDGKIRRPLELTAIPGRDLYAFGLIETTEAQLVEIEVTDVNGQIIQRHFPSVGPETD